jgi:hypothetical protein
VAAVGAVEMLAEQRVPGAEERGGRGDKAALTEPARVRDGLCVPLGRRECAEQRGGGRRALADQDREVEDVERGDCGVVTGDDDG